MHGGLSQAEETQVEGSWSKHLQVFCLIRSLHSEFLPVACTVKVVIYDHNDSAIVIYDHNDSGQYYKTTITAKANFLGS
jgi:hypothetical protein